jgi:LmbE family N-acetylglucosaminyl deacetylase
MSEPSTPDRVLVVMAHPDDVDFGAAGTVATWTDEGLDVVYCIVTDGEAGGSDRSVSRADMAALRREEQTAAAKVVGVTQLHFLGHPDGRLQPTLELRRDISRVIRIVQPTRVITQSPERNFQRIYASHPDHLAAGEATLCAVYPDARNPFSFPELLDEGLEPWTVPEVWMMVGSAHTTWVDITDTFDRKVDALRAHVSQTSHMENLADFLRGWAAAQAEAGGLLAGRLAEGFQVIQTG